MTKCSECRYYDPHFLQHGRQEIDWCKWYRRRIHKTFIRGDNDCPKFDFKVAMLMSPQVIGPQPEVVGPKPDKVLATEGETIIVPKPASTKTITVNIKSVEKATPPAYTKEDLLPIDMNILDKTIQKETPVAPTKRRTRKVKKK